MNLGAGVAWLKRPIMARAGAAFLAGASRAEAMTVAARLDAAGNPVTLAYWNGPQDTPATIEAELLALIDDLSLFEHAPRVSLKAPPLGFNGEVIGRLASAARDAGVSVFFDSHAPGDAGRTRDLALVAAAIGADTGLALPARWARSVADGELALNKGLAVRVVKGQWSDSEDNGTAPKGEAELRTAFQALVDRFAPHASRLSVATHDARLVDSLLRAEVRPFAELELLLGLRSARVLEVSRRRAVPVRWYVPYGEPGVGFSPRELVHRPRLAATLAQAVLLGRGNRRARERELWRAAPEGRPDR